MRSKVKEVAISAELCNLLEMRQYEMDGWRVLCTQLARSGDPVDDILKRYLDSYSAFRLTFAEVLHMFAPECEGNAEYSADVSFHDNKLVVYHGAPDKPCEVSHEK